MSSIALFLLSAAGLLYLGLVGYITHQRLMQGEGYSWEETLPRLPRWQQRAYRPFSGLVWTIRMVLLALVVVVILLIIIASVAFDEARKRFTGHVADESARALNRSKGWLRRVLHFVWPGRSS